MDKSVQFAISKKVPFNIQSNQNLNLFSIQINNNLKSFCQANQNKLITVPIKQYSNKFLRQKKSQDLQESTHKKQGFPSSHLYNNRKLISQFKKYKCRNRKNKKSLNKENHYFIIHNLLFQKDPLLNTQNSHKIHSKTIFGTFIDNQFHNNNLANSTNKMFQRNWCTKQEDSFQIKKQIYQKICENQKQFVPQYKKKCKTFADVLEIQKDTEKNKKMQRISTSRALQKYSKILKTNPEQGKFQKMKIKKQLAKCLRLGQVQSNNIQSKQIILSKKEVRRNFIGKSLVFKKQKSIKTDHSEMSQNKQNEGCRQFLANTPINKKRENQQQCFISNKVGVFSSGYKQKRKRKFSYQANSQKLKTNISKQLNGMDGINQDFQINAWDSSF